MINLHTNSPLFARFLRNNLYKSTRLNADWIIWNYIINISISPIKIIHLKYPTIFWMDLRKVVIILYWLNYFNLFQCILKFLECRVFRFASFMPFIRGDQKDRPVPRCEAIVMFCYGFVVTVVQVHMGRDIAVKDSITHPQAIFPTCIKFVNSPFA